MGAGQASEDFERFSRLLPDSKRKKKCGRACHLGGPAVCPAAWCAVGRKPDGTFQVQDVAVSLSAGQGQIILPYAGKEGKKGREATLSFDFRTCVFTSAPNEKSLSVE